MYPISSIKEINIVVKDKSGNELVYGKDYIINFNSRYTNTNGKTAGARVTASNIYNVVLFGKGDYYGYNTRKTVTIQGIKLKKKFFIINGGNWELSEEGKAAGLVTDDSYSAYFVGFNNVYKNGKRSKIIGGNYCCGEAVDPASRIKIPVKEKKIQLKEAIAKGYVNFTVSDNGAYNIRGAVPDSIVYSSGMNERNKWTPYTLYSGYSTYIRVYDPETNDYKGAAHITFTFKNNTGLGKTAKVMVRVTGGTTLTGSAEIGTYKVNTNEVSDISVFTNTTPDPGDMYYSRVYAVVTDAPKSKGKLDKPDVKLYQVYCDKKGNHKSVALSAKQYTVNTGDELGRNHIAVHTYVTGGKTGEFNFASRYKDQGIYTGVFALYNTKLTADAISAVYVNDTGYKVNKGVIDSSFAPVFTGYKINPKVQKVTAPNAELIINSDYDLHFSINTAAGDKSGTILIQPHYNETTDIYEYGGTVTVNFKIAPAGDITL